MSEYRPKNLLCVVAHPDDIEVTIGGTVAKWVELGTEVCFLICTDGAKGSSEMTHLGEKIAKMRISEQRTAIKALGASCWHQLDYIDREIELTQQLRSDIVKCIRAHKPDAVFTMDPTFLYSINEQYPNHRDHRVVGQAAFDAVYPMARDVSSLPELLAEGFEPHVVPTLLMTNYNNQNFYVDISDHFDKKAEALKAHTSQFGDANWVINKLKLHAQENGEKIGSKLAEGFVKLGIFE